MAAETTKTTKKKQAGTKKSAAKKNAEGRRSNVSPTHPAGYHIDGAKIATLKEVLAPSTPTMSILELTGPQRQRLAVASLAAKRDDFTISMIGPGVINKTRAIAEVRAQSRIGRTIMEIELLMLSKLTEPRTPK